MRDGAPNFEVKMPSSCCVRCAPSFTAHPFSEKLETATAYPYGANRLATRSPSGGRATGSRADTKPCA